MDLKIPKELLDYLDAVRGEKSRQAYLVGMLSDEFISKGKQKLIQAIKKKQ